MINDNLDGLWTAEGLLPEDAAMLQQCIKVWNANKSRNSSLYEVYEGSVSLRKLPASVPARYASMTVACAWPAIAIDAVAERSCFDSFAFGDPDSDTARHLSELVERIDVGSGYSDAVISSQIFGCSFAVVTRDEDGPAVRWHTPLDAGALWSAGKRRILCGFAIVDRRFVRVSDTFGEATVPCAVDFYVDGGCYELTLAADNRTWVSQWLPDPMGQPRMVAFTFRADGQNPLGHTRITRPIRGLVQEYMANSLNIHVNSEFNAIGQKWATGLSDEQLDELLANKWQHSADSVLAVTDNPNTGGHPLFGNFTQQSPEGLLSVKRSLATDFAAAASIPISELVQQDSNPTSAEALDAMKNKLISLVERVNRQNRKVLRTIALMLMAIDSNVGLADLTDEQRSVMVVMAPTATPTPSTMADAAVKLASANNDFAYTSLFWEFVGFDAAKRQRVMAEMASHKATAAITEMMARPAEPVPVDAFSVSALLGEDEGGEE